LQGEAGPLQECPGIAQVEHRKHARGGTSKQLHLGLHQRRLNRLIDSLERELRGSGDARFVIRDHYVARILDLVDLARTAIPKR
jgi:hypothetical protein